MNMDDVYAQEEYIFMEGAKPEAFQDMVETVSPGPYLELFARRQRLGWTCWGNEVDTANATDEALTD